MGEFMGSDDTTIPETDDGSTIASGSDDNTIRLWDPSNGEMETELEDMHDPKLLAPGGSGGFVPDPSNGGMETELEDMHDPVH
ncbi:hypothetical protein T484DRAFT_1790992 [Baffinella frigidus]|nr:hypothetical protein T484DRAFT_1790992 [Cryptophyta sp. CCMP2293]